MSIVEGIESPAVPPAEAATVRSAVRGAVRIAVASVVVAVVMGIAWDLVAPTPKYVAGKGGFYFVSDLPGEFMAMDGWFAVLGVVAGAVLAAVALFRGRPGTLEVIVLAVGAVAGSYLAWGVGHLIGPSRPHASASIADGTIVHGQLTLGAKGVLLAWPIVALAVVMFALAWHNSAARSDEAIASAHREWGDDEVDQSVR
jgi:hypothetical protein